MEALKTMARQVTARFSYQVVNLRHWWDSLYPG